MEYYKLIWALRLDINNHPMIEVDADPLIVIDGDPDDSILHNAINIAIEHKEYLDEVLSEFEDVLSGKEEGGGFSGELLIFMYDKDTYEVYYDGSVVAIFHTQDVYDMLKAFQKYRDDRYAHPNS